MALTNKLWIIGDTHFGHKQVIRYCDRPFTSVENMNETIISNWNKRIKDGHDVIVAGDFSLTSKEVCERICKSLNGNKLLIKGNHDNHSNQYYRDCGFTDVSKYPIIIDEFWIISHMPLHMSANCSFYNIHGHLHNNLAGRNNPDINHYCVSVENTDYMPVEFDKIQNSIIELIEREK